MGVYFADTGIVRSSINVNLSLQIRIFPLILAIIIIRTYFICKFVFSCVCFVLAFCVSSIVKSV